VAYGLTLNGALNRKDFCWCRLNEHDEVRSSLMIGTTVASDVERLVTRPKPISRRLVAVIEDDYQSSLALTMLIDDWGYSCIAARTSNEAIQTLGNRVDQIAAIVTDVEIGGQMRGIKDALAIASALGRPIPTIVTTGHGDYAATSGPFPVIRKPFDPDILHAWLVQKLGYGRASPI
jgi:CheY-like chemotaxis protein